MIGAELGDEFGAVFGGVCGQGFGDDEQCLRELANGQLFAAADREGEFFEVDVQCRFHGAAAGHDGTRFEGPFDGREGVVDRAFHFVQLVFVAPAQDDGGRGECFGAFDEDAFVVGYALLHDFVGVTEVRGFEFLIAIQIAEGGNEGCACGFGDAPEIFLLRTADGHGAFFDEELEYEVVDALGGEEDVCAGLKDHGHALSDNRSFPGTDLFELRGVVDGDVDTELHALFLEIHVQHGDLGVGDASLHGLRGNSTVERIAFNEYRFGS